MAFTVHAVMPGVWHIVDCMGVCMTLLEGENAAMLQVLSELLTLRDHCGSALRRGKRNRAVYLAFSSLQPLESWRHR